MSWVEASITKGHVVSETTVEVMIEGDLTEECAEKQPVAGSIRKIDVRVVESPVSVMCLTRVCCNTFRLESRNRPCYCKIHLHLRLVVQTW